MTSSVIIPDAWTQPAAEALGSRTARHQGDGTQFDQQLRSRQGGQVIETAPGTVLSTDLLRRIASRYGTKSATPSRPI